jgi:hypothetical protein
LGHESNSISSTPGTEEVITLASNQGIATIPAHQEICLSTSFESVPSFIAREKT